MKDIKIKWENNTWAIGKQEFIKRQRKMQNDLGKSDSVKLEYSNWNEDYNLTMFIKKQQIKSF